MIKRLNIIAILIITFLASLLFAEKGYFCVIEKDTLSVNTENALESTVDKYIVSLGDRGFPHVEAILDAYVKKGENEYFHYRIDKDSKVMIDTVVFGDYSPREISLLSRYITLPESGPFHYTLVRDMINELKANTLLNVEDRADIYKNGLRLYTDAKQDIRFDAIASYKQEADRQGVIGNISLELINLGGLGRLASFYWSRPTLGVNSIDLSYTEPYIFNKPFSVKLAFSQRYQDSLYVKRDLDISVLYHMNQRSDFIINYVNEQISTTTVGSDSGFVTQNRSGSNLSLFWRSKPGNISGSVNLTSGLHFALNQRVSRSELTAQLKLRRSILGANINLLGGYVASKDPIALYDQFKLGGANFLRGAYFEQYITNAYVGWKIEAGYFRRAHLFAFYDGVIMQHENPISHHLGVGFSLPAGNNRLTLALGVNLQESIQQAKFHLSWNMGDL
ncbi:MAG: hypothetical protein K9N05_07835 [Candidatus Marinimicrobia bacterium]|nr:hypothetical protein [Candidatus Neomarinimicrobiota bacterium]